MGIVRQSTARTILVGPVLDSTGAAKTDEVVGSLRVTKNGVVGSINGSATLTHNHTGKYLLAYTAADVDTVGITEISLESGTNDMPVVRLNVVEEPVFDALFAGSATGFGNTGSGARTVTITVDDGTTPLQTAKVRLAQGGEAYVGETNVSGVIVFALDDATWDVSITKPGYSFTPTTLVVNGTETVTYSMTAVSIPAPSNPAMATGYIYCWDEDGEAEEGVEVKAYQTAGPGDDGYAYDAEEFTFESDANGLASHAFVRGGRYKVRRGTGKEVAVTVPESATFDLGEMLGYP